VTRVAGNEARLGQAGVKKQLLTQIDHALVLDLGGFDYRHGFFAFGTCLRHHQATGHGHRQGHRRHCKPLFHLTLLWIKLDISVNLYKVRQTHFALGQIFVLLISIVSKQAI
jgi:hypothetical protein